MKTYFDPSFIVALYLPEVRTSSLRSWLESQDEALGLNEWQDLEFRNAARQKVMRGEATEGQIAKTFRIFDDDCIAGRIARCQVPWNEAFAEAERISRKHALSTNCRAFDLIHVAIANLSKSTKRFATLDDGQAQLAEAVGLELVNY